MSEIKFIDHTETVKGAVADLAMATLEEVCGELESQIKRNTKIKTGETEGSWSHKVMQSGEDFEGKVGSDKKNAIWEEFGTGEYALNGDGRKGGWFYVDEEGNGHFTRGKQARRPAWKAYSTMKNKLIAHIQDKFKGGLS